MASSILRNIEKNDYKNAIKIAETASLRSTSVYYDAKALAAFALFKIGRYESALEYWDQIIKDSTRKMKWIAPALQVAWNCMSEYARAAQFAENWIKLLETIYSELPPIALLAACRLHGWNGVGSVGIHEEKLKGWALIKSNETLCIATSLPQESGFSIAMTPRATFNGEILFAIEKALPKAYGQFRLALSAGSGKELSGSPVICSPSSCVSAKKTKKTCPTVSIILPVYDDAGATLRCLGSVFASLKANKTQARIKVVWDKGPDQNLLVKLRKLAARNKIELNENAENMGFLATVNTALARIEAGDVILLNSDTLVHGDWIDRLKVIGDRRDVATVTALSNEAELMSYPSETERGRLTRLSQVKLLDGAAARLGETEAAQIIPVGVGFCMLITRCAIEKIGLLDGLFLFKGYGEEVEYCLRAADMGLKNYGAFNVFVAHMGEKSFGVRKRALVYQNNAAIKKRYPDYARKYENFLHAKKTALLREAISKNILYSVHGIKKLELRPWSMQDLPPWKRGESDSFKETRAALFLRSGTHACALLRLQFDVPIGDMTFSSSDELAELGEIIKRLHFESFESYGNRNAYMDLASQLIEGQIVESQLAHIDRLPPDHANKKVIISAPPLDLHQWLGLREFARKNSSSTFYVYGLDRLGPYLIKPSNLMHLPALKDLSVLFPDIFLFPSMKGEREAWSQWLERHGLGDLQIFGMSEA